MIYFSAIFMPHTGSDINGSKKEKKKKEICFGTGSWMSSTCVDSKDMALQVKTAVCERWNNPRRQRLAPGETEVRA
ncbi:hypothetical protein AAFF_G00101690 [Aldrovandia affinis]|uniref:Uncharacterized protein n=1 Tax=Aldrovandia affinis TaxID=143900 RepID=A0AAD7RUK4_9TELE|nr:hypothetical protein AAFF_G00101690 [Aldrovandia affinis]